MNYTKKSGLISLGILVGLSFALIYITNHEILTPEFYANSGQTFAGISGQDKSVYASYQKWIYIDDALYIFLKSNFVALLLYTALYLASLPVQFLPVLGIVIRAEFVFLLAAAGKVLWFHLAFPHGTLADWHRLYLLSVLSLFPEAPADWTYALQTLNVFELVYCLLLAAGIKSLTAIGFLPSLKLVLASYLPALLIWVISVTFCTLLFFPNHG